MLAACLQTKIAAQFQLPQNRHLKPAGEASPAQRRPGHPPDGRRRNNQLAPSCGCFLLSGSLSSGASEFLSVGLGDALLEAAFAQINP